MSPPPSKSLLNGKKKKELKKLKKEWAKGLESHEIKILRVGSQQKREERKREIFRRRREEWKRRVVEVLRRASTCLSPSEISSYTGIDEAFLPKILLDLIYENKIEKNGYAYKIRKKLKLDVGF
jgi:hypothetical protein